MSLSHRSTLLTALLAGLLAFAPAAAWAAQPPDEEGGGEDIGGGDDDDDDDDDNDAAAEEASDESPGDDDDAASAADKPPSDLSGWGVGGAEHQGKYGPSGKTGKLKELEDEQAEERERLEGPPELPPPGFAYLDTAIGFGSLLVPTQSTGRTVITPTASFLIGVGYRVGDVWQIAARFPISTGVSDGPRDPYIAGARNPDEYKQIATGGLELEVKPHFILSRDLRLPIGLAVVFPTGTGDVFADVDSRAELGKAIVNMAASASRGWEDRALFAHQRFGIVPSIGILWGNEVGPGKLRLSADTKVEIMLKTGGADPADRNADGVPDVLPQGEEAGESSDAAVSWLLRPSVFYDLFDGLLSPGVKLWMVVGTDTDSRGSISPDAGLQFVFEPNVGTHLPFTDSDTVGIDGRVAYMIPLGGELAGDNPQSASVGGLRLTAGLFF